jgi:hypothetical protein
VSEWFASINEKKNKNMKVPSVNLIARSPLRLGFHLIPLALACLALLPQAQAVCHDGCDLINANTFLGDDALANNTTGTSNTATGAHALQQNTEGLQNTAIGSAALTANTTGGANTAIGSAALQRNTTGGANTAIGSVALFSNTTGADNTATGVGALSKNKIGSNNTAVGADALHGNTRGSSNIALGVGAGGSIRTGSNNIEIGNRGVADESNTIRIGTVGTHDAASIAGISGATVAGGVGVIVDNNGKLGTIVSSARFKDAIKPMDKESKAILALKPVSFRYKREIDPEGIPHFGLVAEDVDKVNPDLVARDAEGKVFTVRYEAVNAMLLNEFLKAHRRIEEQDKRIDQLTAQLKEQAEQIRKVKDKVEMNRTAPQMVVNDR